MNKTTNNWINGISPENIKSIDKIRSETYTNINSENIKSNDKISTKINIQIANKGAGSKKKIKRLSKKKLRLAKMQAAAMLTAVPKTFVITLQGLLPEGIPSEVIQDSVDEIIQKHNSIIKNHGVVSGTQRYNSIRLYAIRLLEDQNPEPLDRVSLGKKDRWPSIFNKLRPLFYRVRDTKCHKSDQIIRSILYLTRLCKGNSVIDLGSITKECTLKEGVVKRFDKYLEGRNLSKDRKRRLLFEGELITKPTLRVTANGPNGRPKWMTAEQEAYLLIHSELNTSFRELCLITGNMDLYEYMSHLASNVNPVDRIKLRYIVSLPDKGNKARVIAISDYWTQILLQPIMLDVKDYTNRTFPLISSSWDHRNGFELLKKHIKPGVVCHDISSWTDRHPARLQHIFMKHRYGSTIADNWYDLVVNCQWNVKGNTDTIKYSAGQGMGTNGSFDIATATNMLLMEMIFEDHYQTSLSESNFNETGDDQWSFDPDKIVESFLTEDLGMEISIAKTKYATESNLVGEYVSRNINHGHDVSRISANICRAVSKNILDLPELIRHLDGRVSLPFKLNLKEVFKSAKIKDKHVPKYVRTFFFLSYMMEEGGLLLRGILIDNYLEMFETDPQLNFFKDEEGRSAFYNNYILYSCDRLLQSITDKADKIGDICKTFKSYKELEELGDPAMWWLTLDESLAVKTSKLALIESHKALHKIFDKDQVWSDAISHLEAIDASLTFKDLGVISTDRSPLRPKTSRLYNIISRLVVLESQDGITFNNERYPKVRNGIAKDLTFGIERYLHVNLYMLPSTLEKFLGLSGIPFMIPTIEEE